MPMPPVTLDKRVESAVASGTAVPEATAGSAQRYRSSERRRRVCVVLMGLALLCSVLVDVGWGPSSVGLLDVMATLIDPSGAEPRLSVIVWDLRLPIELTALLVGAMLGVAGAEMQTILNNPLADPFTLGISSAASFGAALAIVLQVNLVPFAGSFLVTANAFVLALSTSFVLYAFTRLCGVTAETLVPAGRRCWCAC